MPDTNAAHERVMRALDAWYEVTSFGPWSEDEERDLGDAYAALKRAQDGWVDGE